MGIWNPDLSGFWIIKKDWASNGPDYVRDLKSGSPTNKNHTNGSHSTKTTGQKCPDFEWSGFWKVETKPYLKPDHLKSDLHSSDFKCYRIQKCRISDPHCISVKLNLLDAFSSWNLHQNLFRVDGSRHEF